MSISLLDSGPRTSSAPQTDTFDRLREADRTSPGPRFGQVMADMQNRQSDNTDAAGVQLRSRPAPAERPDRQEVADARDARDARHAQDARNASDARDYRIAQEARESQEARDTRNTRESRDAQDARSRQTTANDTPRDDRSRSSSPDTSAQQVNPQRSDTTARDSATSRSADDNAVQASNTDSTTNTEGSGQSEVAATNTPDSAVTKSTDTAAETLNATATRGDHDTGPTDFSLKAVTLGPNLNVITPEKAATNEQSLEAFARSQGLDEKAVQWLMGGDGRPGGKTAPGSLNPAMSATATDETGLNADGTEDAKVGNGLNTSTTASDSLKAGLYGSMFIASTLQRPAAPPAPTGLPADGAATAAAAAQAPGTDDAALTNPHMATAATAAPGGANTAPAGGAQSAIVSAFTALMQGKSDDSLGIKSAVHAASTESQGLADLQNSGFRLPPPAAMWMQQIKQATPLTTPSTSTKTVAISTSEIDLSADISPDLIDQLGSSAPQTPGMSAASHPTPGSANAAPALSTRNDTTANPSTAPAPQADAAQRSENIQNLATKMGQAVGERILSEIEKGQFHLKLQLRPATLGHIEVEMRMRSGEMDATFTAPQALTRELLQEGMSRLKETMSQMGMNVANFNVGDGQTQQRGGESTPQSPALAGSAKASAPATTETVTANAPRAKISADGLDVLV